MLQASGKEDSLFLSELQKFNEQHSGSATFIPQYGLETKKKFVDALVKELKKVDQKDEIKLAILHALRLCCREEEGMDSLSDGETVKFVMETANLQAKGNTTNENVSEEALKCLVNILVKLKGTSELFAVLRGLQFLVSSLENTKASDSKAFPLCRILLQLSSDTSRASELTKLKVIPILTRLIEESLSHDVPLSIAGDLLKTIFTLTISLGPLHSFGGPSQPTSEQISDYKKLFPLYKKVLNLPADQLPLKLTIVSCLINTPAECNEMLSDEDILRELVEILRVQLQQNDLVDALTPILVLLTHLTQNVPSARTSFRKAILPEKINEDVTMEGTQENVSLSAKIKTLMTSSNVALKHYAQQFLFVLCNEEGEEFSRLVGLGLGAGLLQEQQMLNMFTRLKPTQKDNSMDDMTEEEKEKAAEELGEKLERLQSLGVFNVMQKKE